MSIEEEVERELIYCDHCYQPTFKIYRVVDWYDRHMIDCLLCLDCARRLANGVPAESPSHLIEDMGY